jgi:hypothetical protein
VLSGGLQPLVNQIDIALGCPDSARRFLLKRMQNVNSPLKSHCVHRSVCISLITLDDFENSRSLALPRLRRRKRSTKLGYPERITNLILGFGGEK